MAAPVMAQGMAQPVYAQQVRVRHAQRENHARALGGILPGSGAKLPGPSARTAYLWGMGACVCGKPAAVPLFLLLVY